MGCFVDVIQQHSSTAHIHHCLLKIKLEYTLKMLKRILSTYTSNGYLLSSNIIFIILYCTSYSGNTLTLASSQTLEWHVHYYARMAPTLEGLDFSFWFHDSLMGLFLHIVSTVDGLLSCGGMAGFFLGSFSNSESLENSLRLRKLQSNCFPSDIVPPSLGSYRAK